MSENNIPVTFELEVQGMTCDGCARAVKNAVKKVDARADVVVLLDRHRVIVKTVMSSEESDKQLGQLQSAIDRAGFQVVRV